MDELRRIRPRFLDSLENAKFFNERANELHGRNDARLMFEHIATRLEEFEYNLGENEEIGMQLANIGLAAQIHIRSIGYKDPCLIEFRGLDRNKNDVTIIQHLSQLNLVLVALKPVEEKPFRVGFHQN